MNNLNQTINDFADYILQTPEFIELHEATKQLNNNKEALDILQSLQEKKQTVFTLQQTGLPVSEKQQQELQCTFARMRANAICMRVIKAQNAAIQLARKVCNQLTQATGIPFAGGGGCCGQIMKNVKKIIRDRYGKIAQNNTSCCYGGSCCGGNVSFDDISKSLGYSKDQLTSVPTDANMGLGCGNPIAISSLKEGEVVLDLGSGGGFDAFLAARKIGKTGKVIGVDMTDEMIRKAKENAVKGNFTNVEFRKGDIEQLPVENNSIDVIISNCVINLAPHKEKVFREAYRVLKPNGKMVISDIVLIKQLPNNFKEDAELLAGCVGGAILKQDYIKLLEKAGFSEIKIHKETPMFLEDYGLSITFSAVKPN